MDISREITKLTNMPPPHLGHCRELFSIEAWWESPRPRLSEGDMGLLNVVLLLLREPIWISLGMSMSVSYPIARGWLDLDARKPARRIASWIRRRCHADLPVCSTFQPTSAVVFFPVLAYSASRICPHLPVLGPSFHGQIAGRRRKAGLRLGSLSSLLFGFLPTRRQPGRCAEVPFAVYLARSSFWDSGRAGLLTASPAATIRVANSKVCVRQVSIYSSLAALCIVHCLDPSRYRLLLHGSRTNSSGLECEN